MYDTWVDFYWQNEELSELERIEIQIQKINWIEKKLEFKLKSALSLMKKCWPAKWMKK